MGIFVINFQPCLIFCGVIIDSLPVCVDSFLPSVRWCGYTYIDLRRALTLVHTRWMAFAGVRGWVLNYWLSI